MRLRVAKDHPFESRQWLNWNSAPLSSAQSRSLNTCIRRARVSGGGGIFWMGWREDAGLVAEYTDAVCAKAVFSVCWKTRASLAEGGRLRQR